MSVIIGSPPNISILNQQEVAFLKGTELVDDSVKFAIDEDTGIPTIQVREIGLWQTSPFQVSSESLYIDIGLALSRAGGHLLTSDTAGTYRFFSHSTFDGEVSTSDARMPNAYEFQEEEVIQSDESSEVNSTTFSFIVPATIHEIIRKAYIKTGASTTDEDVRVRVYQGSDDTGDKIFDHKYPASDFPINSTIEISTEGFIELKLGKNYFFKIESEDSLSLKTNADEDFPWLAVDRSLFKEDDMLQTTEWISGNTFEIGQLSIQDRNIYSCNTEGVQELHFALNPDSWNKFTANNFSYNEITTPKITIDTGQQMIVHGEIKIDGELIINGELCLV